MSSKSMMKLSAGLMLLVTTTSPSCLASDIKLGNMVATHRQICGKSIELNLADLNEPFWGQTLIGLKNNQSGEVDLFMSKTPTMEYRQYEQYDKVIFDSLSKNFIRAPGNIAIVWGSSHVSMQKEESFSLAFGSYVYSCQKLEKLPDETANKLYGESNDK